MGLPEWVWGVILGLSVVLVLLAVWVWVRFRHLGTAIHASVMGSKGGGSGSVVPVEQLSSTGGGGGIAVDESATSMPFTQFAQLLRAEHAEVMVSVETWQSLHRQSGCVAEQAEDGRFYLPLHGMRLFWHL